jgi:hypothetical protein
MMDLTKVVQLNQVKDELDKKSVFISCISYEERSMSVFSMLTPDDFEKTYVFYSKQFFDFGVRERVEHIKLIYGESYNQIEYMLDDPIEIARSISKMIANVVKSESKKLVVDATTFTHEMILMITKVVHEYRSNFESIKFLYVSADDYSVGDKLKDKWLSKGCKDVRNVLGYPGKLRPTVKTCLILLAGFEHERATKLIELLEPERIELGNGIESTSDNHIPSIIHFRNEFEKLFHSLSGRGNSRFDFSCKDILSTANSIMDIVKKHPDENIIIVPLNTKLSTIAAAFVAIMNPNIQVAYAIAEAYNTTNYSTPGDHVTVINMKQLFDININTCLY